MACKLHCSTGIHRCRTMQRSTQPAHTHGLNYRPNGAGGGKKEEETKPRAHALIFHSRVTRPCTGRTQSRSYLRLRRLCSPVSSSRRTSSRSLLGPPISLFCLYSVGFKKKICEKMYPTLYLLWGTVPVPYLGTRTASVQVLTYLGRKNGVIRWPVNPKLDICLHDGDTLRDFYD